MIKTKQELLNHFSDINAMYNNPFEYQTLSNMIDELLEQQPSEDCISREAVNVLIDELARAISDERCFVSRGRATSTIMQDILELPSVTPKYTDEEIDKAQLVEQAYVDKMVELAVKETERPKGKWIQTKDDCDGVNFYDFSFKCSKCGKEQSFKSNYCPNCGADMRGKAE